MSDPFDLMAFAEEETRGSGGGYICQFMVSAGYLVFAKGDRAARFFRVDADQDKETAKEAAKEMAKKAQANYEPVINLDMFADSVINKDTPTWQGGVWSHDFVVWQDAYKEILRPGLQLSMEDGLENNVKAWGHISFKPDPRKPERADGQPNLKPYIIRVFENESDALEYFQDGGDEKSTYYVDMPAVPDEWAGEYPDNAEGSWRDQWLELITNFMDNPEDTDYAAWVWDDAGLTLEIVSLAAVSAAELADDEDLPF